MAPGLGTFMTAQIVADLKYLPTIRQASDWWTWASPGPGSRKGLSLVFGRDINYKWNDKEWLGELCALNIATKSMLEEIGIPHMHNQDLQNCLCEFSKFEKTRLGLGRPRQVFHHV